MWKKIDHFIFNKKTAKTYLSILSGTILSLGWYEWGSGLFLLIAFVPLLMLEETIASDPSLRKKNSTTFFYALLSFLVWNLLATWWIINASFAGMLAAVIVSSFFMSVPFWLYSIVKRYLGRYIGYFALIVFWLAYEFSYTHGEISWPWLTLGNGFEFNTKLIQWFEYTGVFGGTLWVLIVNVLLFELIRKLIQGESIRKNKLLVIKSALFIFVPILFSLIIYYTFKETMDPREIVVVQPNIDPYLKFNDIPSIDQTEIMLDCAEKYTRQTTDYVVCPETSINHNIWIGQFNVVPDFNLLRDLLQINPGLKIVTGISCYKRYTDQDKTPTARPLYGSDFFYDYFNSAIQIDSTKEIQIYHKSMLVIGVEKMPYPGILKFLQPLTLRLGGTFRSDATQKERSVLVSQNDSTKVGTAICYESVYGEFVTEYVKKGANILFVITNDGWWGNTPGHRQHNGLSRIRAIETRRSIARSANTGISCFINQRGDILDKLTWWKRGAMRNSLNVNNRLTFYVKHGDYIARGSFYLAIVLLLTVLVKISTERLRH